MKHLILGTAGHIDHGKSSLVLSLTGTDPDRLKEEKERGITIDLGFAHLDLPNGDRVGIVDVPGHERFVRTMVAGVTGVDLVALVIAADEGVMPQTREHLDICQMLGVKTGFVVLSKVDLVDSDWLELVKEDLKTFLSGTFLEDAPVLEFSAKDKRGLEDVKQTIEQLAGRIEPKSAVGSFRLPVDRVFTMKGFGTVITGTAVEGSAHVGEELEILPGSRMVKIRGIQSHGEAVETAEAGNRTAINLQGISTDDIQRGEVLATPGGSRPTYMVDVWLQHLSSSPRPLKTRDRIRLHIGTSEILARIIPMEDEALLPGSEGYAQLRLEQPGVCRAGDRFVLRSYSPMITIGGGRVINPFAAKHKRPFENALEQLNILDTGEPGQQVNALYQSAGRLGLSLADLKSFLRLSDKKAKDLLAGLLSRGEIVRYDKEKAKAVSKEEFDLLCLDILELLSSYHEKNPRKPGIPKAELEEKTGHGRDPLFIEHALSSLSAGEKLVLEKELVRLPEHKVILPEEEKKLEEQILSEYRDAGLMTPTVKEVADKHAGSNVEIPALLRRLAQAGKLLPLSQSLYLETSVLNDLKEKLASYFKENEKLDAQGFKGLTGLSRKFAIPILEYLDKDKFTIRVGDARVLRKKIS